MTREKDIMHDTGPFWVGRNAKGYGVYRNGITHSTLDSDTLYDLTPDDLSIAVARCNYLTRNLPTP